MTDEEKEAAEAKHKEVVEALRGIPSVTSFGGSTFLIWKSGAVSHRVICKRKYGGGWKYMFYRQGPGHTYKVEFEEFLDSLPEDRQDWLLFHLNLFT
jgi:hypothetical protein